MPMHILHSKLGNLNPGDLKLTYVGICLIPVDTHSNICKQKNYYSMIISSEKGKKQKQQKPSYPFLYKSDSLMCQVFF